MTNMSIQPLWLTHFIEILLVPEFQLTKFIVGVFSYNALFRPQISSSERFCCRIFLFLETYPCFFPSKQCVQTKFEGFVILGMSLIACPLLIFTKLSNFI